MFTRDYQPLLVESRVTGVKETLDVNASRSEDGQTLILKAVNPTDQAVPAHIHLAGFIPKKNLARVSELSAELDAKNTAAEPNAVAPQYRDWQHGLKDGQTAYSFPARSITIIKWE